MLPFKDKSMQKAFSIIFIIAGVALTFNPFGITNGFLAGVILAVLGAIYLIDLQ